MARYHLAAMADYFAHPSAVIDDGAQIGAGTKIWHFSHVMGGARIGAGCSLGQNVFVAGNVTIGDGARIQNNVSVYEGVVLEDDVFCGPSVVFTNVKTPRAGVPRNSSDDYVPTVVRRGATLGANVTIVCGVVIGSYATVAAGCVVTRDVPPHALVAGVPGRRVVWVCACGVPLAEDGDRLTCPECGGRYRVTPDGLEREAGAGAPPAG